MRRSLAPPGGLLRFRAVQSQNSCFFCFRFFGGSVFIFFMCFLCFSGVTSRAVVRPALKGDRTGSGDLQNALRAKVGGDNQLGRKNGFLRDVYLLRVSRLIGGV